MKSILQGIVNLFRRMYISNGHVHIFNVLIFLHRMTWHNKLAEKYRPRQTRCVHTKEQIKFHWKNKSTNCNWIWVRECAWLCFSRVRLCACKCI